MVGFFRKRVSGSDGSRGKTQDGGPTLRDTFGAVYRENRWGTKWFQSFFSGPGSHDAAVVDPYVAAVSEFLRSLTNKPDVVDLGCGDFNVGSRLRDDCAQYVACDIVPDLVAHNTKAFKKLQVDFRCIDLVADELPRGDVAMIRQVLQHLSNEQVARIVAKLAPFKYLVITEHLPIKAGFQPNLEHTHGAGVRLQIDSGIVLTAPPFNLQPRSQRRLCRVEKYGGVIVTDLYEL